MIIEASFFEIVFQGNSRARMTGIGDGLLAIKALGKRLSRISRARMCDVSGAVNLHRVDLRSGLKFRA